MRVTARCTVRDFAEELHRLVDEGYAQAEQIVLVTVNLNTHTPACLYERFAPEEGRRIARSIGRQLRCRRHYTLEHGSWLNITECEPSVLSGQCLNRRIADPETLVREAGAWEARRNAAYVTTDGQFATVDARIKLKRLNPVVKGQNLD